MFQYQIAANKRRTTGLIVVFILFITLLGGVIGYAIGPDLAVVVALIAFAVAIIMSVTAYYNSDKTIMHMTGAREVTKAEYPYLVNTVEGLCLAAGLDTVPRVCIMENDSPNAFATGRDPSNSAVCVTTGLLSRLNRQQLEGVLAHEMAHVYNRDILIMGIAAALVGTIIIMCELVLRGRLFYFGGRGSSRSSGGGQAALIYIVLMIVAAILAPIVAKILQMAISRTREYQADATAIKLTRNPEGLAGALEVIANTLQPMPEVSTATAHLFIDDPMRAAPTRNWFETMFSTHPPIWDRIDRIRNM
jgi:heat shock protein HtpX